MSTSELTIRPTEPADVTAIFGMIFELAVFEKLEHMVVADEAMLLPKADPVHKVTIMPRGWALGLTWQ